MKESTPVVMQSKAFPALLDALKRRRYQTIGPTVRDNAIVYDHLDSVDQLPVGYVDEQKAGSYRMTAGRYKSYFSYTVGPHSWKRFLFPPEQRLLTVTRENGTARFQPESPEPVSYAFIGVRACEIHALQIQDRVYCGGQYVDSHYSALREHLFLVAVNCTRAGGTCFCASMNTGPRVDAGFDLALTEVLHGKEHYFVVEADSPKGEEILAEIPHEPATAEQVKSAERKIEAAADSMGRALEIKGIKQALYRNYEHPRWDDVAERCMACANCTMVCPTCFCHTVEDATDLTGDHAERWRKWDSCFTQDFSYVHGGSIRTSTKARYRQWLTHKLAAWIDQFGTSGCVGCGRCITWCPVGIDITEEAQAVTGNLNGEMRD